MRILIVDDHEALCELLARYIETEAASLLGEAAAKTQVQVVPLFTLAQAIEAVTSDPKPDLVILDLGLDAQARGAVTLRKFQEANTANVPVAVFTGLVPSIPEAPQIYRECLDKLNARGIIIKKTSTSKMFIGLSRILAGEQWVSEEVFKAMLKPVQDEETQFGLTPTEWKVAQAISRGLSNKEIAREMTRSHKHIAQVTTVIFQKLGVKNRTAAAIKVSKQRATAPG